MALCLGGLIAVRAIPLLLVCLLGLGVVANAAAAGAAAAGGMSAGAGCTAHNGNSERDSSRDTSSYSGDAMNVPRSNGSSVRSTSSGSRSGNANGSSMDDSPFRFSNGDAAPDGSSHGSSGLSWQSLLPGSIQ